MAGPAFQALRRNCFNVVQHGTALRQRRGLAAGPEPEAPPLTPGKGKPALVLIVYVLKQERG